MKIIATYSAVRQDLNTLVDQGIHDLQVWPQVQKVSHRAMHEALFEAGWQRCPITDD